MHKCQIRTYLYPHPPSFSQQAFTYSGCYRRPSASSDDDGDDGDDDNERRSVSSKMTTWHYCPTYLLFFLPPPRFARPPLAAQPASPFFLPCASLLLFFATSCFRHPAIRQKNCQELFFFIIPPTFPSSLVGMHCSF